MEPNPNYTRVGIFVIGCIALFTVTILWLQGSFSHSNESKYLVKFSQQSLDGLQKESTVSMKGIKVGSVEDYQIYEDNIEEVHVILSIENNVPVKVDTEAVIKRNLLTGLARIDLVGGTQDSPTLKRASKATLPVIKEGVAGIDKIADSIPSLLARLETLIDQTTSVFSEKNVAYLTSTLKSSSAFTASLEKSGPQIETSLVRLDSILKTIDGSIKSASGENLEQAIRDLTGSAKELRALLKHLREVSESLQPLLTTTSRTTQNIDGNIKSMTRFLTSFLDRYSNLEELLANPKNEDK